MPEAPDQAESEALRQYLAGRDVTCPACGYNLRGLTSGRCPECNQELALRVGLIEARMGAYLGALAGHLGAAGAAVVCLAIALVFTIKHGPPGSRENFAVYGIPGIILATQGVAALLLSRRSGRVWFRRRTGLVRSLVVVSGWVMLAGFVTWFLSIVM